MDETAKLNAMRQYWLGLLPEETRLAHESLWFDSDDDAELLAAVREELIQDYLAGELEGAELAGFRNHLLGDLNFIEDVAIASAIYSAPAPSAKAPSMVETRSSKTESWFAGFVSGVKKLFSSPVPAVAFGTVLMAILIGGIVLWRSTSEEIAVIDVPTPANYKTLPDPGNHVNGSIEPDQPVPNKNTKDNTSVNSAPKTPNPGNSSQSYITLVLGVAVRGENHLPEISIPEKNGNLRLVLTMPGLVKTYQDFSVRIVSADSAKTVWQKPLGDLNSKRKGEDLFVTVPKGDVPAGEYKLVLTGTLPGSNSENIYERGFRILK